MEQVMRSSISYIALAVALAAGTSAANAQTVIDQPVSTVITQQPVQTVRTTETVQTVRPRATLRRQVVTTRRTTVSQQIVPTQTVTTPVVGTNISAIPQPLYDQAPLYDTVAAPTVDETVLNAPAAVNTMPAYRYVYEPDRILVIDPATGIAVQALPR
jgi:hypothetical protein